MRLGSLIGLKLKYEERYIILHKHTFPEVLDRIRKSNIRNYSIFLKEGILFSFLEYWGANLEADMAEIAGDAVTRDWWKLTDPMQVPLEGRKEGEWWTQMEEIFHWTAPNPPARIWRGASLAAGLTPETLRKVSERLQTEGPVLLSSSEAEPLFSLTLFVWKDRLCAYIETAESSEERADHRFEVQIPKLTGTPASVWAPMTEVFHTD